MLSTLTYPSLSPHITSHVLIRLPFEAFWKFSYNIHNLTKCPFFIPNEGKIAG